MNLFDVYSLLDLEFERAQAEWIWDLNGKKYLDLYGGHAVISIGHSHPKYVEKIKSQLDKISFFSNSVRIGQQQELANRLGRLSSYQDYQLFLCNSGAEANENALKLASFHSAKAKVMAFKGAFHGRTSGAVAVTDNPKIQSSFNQGHQVEFVDFDLEQIEKRLKTEDFAAIIFEPIQGVNGIRYPKDSFFKDLARLAKIYNTLLIADEVQSGYGRTGKFFAHQYAEIQPDIITTAKGMGNGFPIGGVLISPKIKPQKSMLGTTFGGNHLACAAGISVLDVMEEEGLVEKSKELGEDLIQFLKENSEAKEIRGRGLMIGLEYESNMKKIKQHLLEKHNILTGLSGYHTLRLLPPLNIQENSIEQFKKALIQTEDIFLA